MARILVGRVERVEKEPVVDADVVELKVTLRVNRSDVHGKGLDPRDIGAFIDMLRHAMQIGEPVLLHGGLARDARVRNRVDVALHGAESVVPVTKKDDGNGVTGVWRLPADRVSEAVKSHLDRIAAATGVPRSVLETAPPPADPSWVFKGFVGPDKGGVQLSVQPKPAPCHQCKRDWRPSDGPKCWWCETARPQC